MELKKRVAVVILNWNGKKFLEKFLPSILSYSIEFADVIIADNDSTDDSTDFLKTSYPNVEVIILGKNYGFTGGYNRALKQLDYEYFILLNSDVEVTPNWIQPIITFMDQHPDVAACQPKILSFSDRHLLEHAGGSGGYIDYLGYPFCRGRIYTTLEEDKHQYDSIEQIFWSTGACMFIRSIDFFAADGFDEEFFAHMEEIDLCWRLQHMGKKIYVIPDSFVYHVGGGTLPKSSSRKTYYNFRNNLMMLHKNLPANKMFFIIFFRLFLDGIAGIKFLIDGDYKDTFAVFKAHMYFYYTFLRRQKIRSKIQSSIQNKTLKGVYNNSIVADYYIFNRKYFNMLNQKEFIK